MVNSPRISQLQALWVCVIVLFMERSNRALFINTNSEQSANSHRIHRYTHIYSIYTAYIQYVCIYMYMHVYMHILHTYVYIYMFVCMNFLYSQKVTLLSK